MKFILSSLLIINILPTLSQNVIQSSDDCQILSSIIGTTVKDCCHDSKVSKKIKCNSKERITFLDLLVF